MSVNIFLIFFSSENTSLILPDFFYHRLYLAHNRLNDLSESIPNPVGEKRDTALSSCGLSFNLTRLELSHNKIQQLPVHLGSLNKLEELYITQNLITQLPETICALENLTTLLIDDNLLKELPEDIGSCKNLIRLDANANNLVKLPESLVKIKTIETLMFSNNSITDLPNWVTHLSTVKYLDYTKNSIPVDNANETIVRLKKNNPYIVEAKFF